MPDNKDYAKVASIYFNLIKQFLENALQSEAITSEEYQQTLFEVLGKLQRKVHWSELPESAFWLKAQDRLKTEGEEALIKEGRTVAPGVREFGGQHYDEQGRLLSPDIAKRKIEEYWEKEEDTLSSYQKAQLDFDLRQLEQRQKEFETEQAFKRQQFEFGQAQTQREFEAEQQYRGWQMRQSDVQRDIDEERRAMESNWRVWKAERETELERGGPMNWIRLWYLRNQPNPFQAQQWSPAEGAIEAKRALNQTISMMEQTRQAAVEAAAQGDDKRLVNLQKRHANLLKLQVQEEKEAEVKQKFAAEQVTSRQIAGEIIGPATPKVPSTPDWLPQFAPGLTGGQPLEKTDVTTPSAQQWTRTPWSQQQMLRGYTDWAGQSYEDLIGGIARPEFRRGPSWQPATQRG